MAEENNENVAYLGGSKNFYSGGMKNIKTPVSQIRQQAIDKAAQAKQSRQGKMKFSERFLEDKLKPLREQMSQYQGLGEEDLIALGPSTRRVARQVKGEGSWGGKDDLIYNPGGMQTIYEDVALSREERLAAGKASNLSRIQGLQQRLANPEGELNDPIMRDLMKGARFGESIVGEEGLGRLEEDVDVQEAMARKKSIADEGLSRAEVEAEKSQMFKEIQGSGETSRRGLQAALARAGVKGGMAGQQIAANLLGTEKLKADASRDIFLKSEQVKREGLKDYSQSLGEMKTFDLGQAAAEKNIVLQAGLGIAQVGSSERAAKYAAEQARLAKEASARAASSACFTGNAEIVMEDGSLKKISEIELGDMTSNGEVTAIGKAYAFYDLYEYKGLVSTGSHVVLEDGKYKRVENCKDAKKVDMPEDTIVYPMDVANGWYETSNGVRSWSFTEVEGSCSYEESIKELNRRVSGTNAIRLHA